MSQLTDKLLKDLVGLKQRITDNRDNVPREIFLFLPTQLVNKPSGLEVLNLASTVRKAKIGAEVTVQKAKDLASDGYAGLEVIIKIDKGTDLEKLKDIFESLA